MKRKNIIAFVFALLMAIPNAFSIKTSAFDEASDCFGKVDMVSDYVKHYTLGDGIIKKEVVSTYKYVYSRELENLNERYISLQTNVSYTEEATNKVLAIASMEANFRYNPITKEAVCLSSTKGNVLNVEGCELSIYSIPANLTTQLGGSIVSLKFKYNGKIYDDVVHEIICDYLGNINYK